MAIKIIIQATPDFLLKMVEETFEKNNFALDFYASRFDFLSDIQESTYYVDRETYFYLRD